MFDEEEASRKRLFCTIPGLERESLDRRSLPKIALLLVKFQEAMAQEFGKAQAAAFYWRYCDFWLVDGEKELNVPPLRQIAPPLPRKPATAKDDPIPTVPGNTPSKRVSRKGSVSNAYAMISFRNFTLPQAWVSETVALRLRNRRRPAESYYSTCCTSWPTSGLCRVGVIFRGLRSRRGAVIRHNTSPI
jgi:hypothetical protein